MGEEHTQRRLTFYVRSATLWTSGTVLFSGSIYALSLGAGERFKMLGPITPVRSLSLACMRPSAHRQAEQAHTHRKTALLVACSHSPAPHGLLLSHSLSPPLGDTAPSP